MNTRLKTAAAGVALSLSLSLATSGVRPASADGAASTRNIVLGAVALVAGDIIYNNIHHKAVQHDTVVGYTRDGGTLYADGHVTYPSGDVLYTANGGSRCSYDGRYQPCGAQPVAYYPQGYRGHPHGNAYGHGNGYGNGNGNGYGYGNGNSYGHGNDDRDEHGKHHGERGHGDDGDHGNRGDDGGHGDH